MAADDDALKPPVRFAFAGDWHMNAAWAEHAVATAAELGVHTILHTGDFGYLFFPRFVQPLHRALETTGMQLLFADGNHDDHELLAALHPWPSGLRRISDRIWWLPRGFRWEWGGVRFLALGGAHSVDVQQRRNFGDPWWPEETITPAQAAAAATAGRADVMLTHDCPYGVDIPGLHKTASWFPKEELARSAEHRKVLRGVVDQVRPRLLVHGHYHRSYRADVDFGWPMHVVGLNCDGTSTTANLHIVDIADLVTPPGATR